MTRSTLKELLKRQLNDVTSQDWDNSALEEALDHGTFEAAKVQFAILPDSLKARSKSDLKEDVDLYSKPPDSWMIYMVRIKGTDGKYHTIRRADYDIAIERAEGGETTWSHFGRYIAILPVPTACVTAGLQVIYVPIAGTSIDTTTPEANNAIPSLHVGLHRLILLEAALALLPETGEATVELKAARNRIVEMAPTWLRADAAEPVQVRVEGLVKDY